MLLLGKLTQCLPKFYSTNIMLNIKNGDIISLKKEWKIFFFQFAKDFMIQP